MTRKPFRSSLFLPLFCLALLAGCSNDAGQPAPPAPAPRAEAPAPAPAAPAGGHQAEKLRVTLLPESPGSADDLVAMVAGTPATSDFSWTVNGLPVDGAGTSRLGHQHFAKHDRVAVTARSAGQEATTEVEIRNTPPQVVSVGYRPRVIRHGEALTAVPRVEDADGDPISLQYRWFVNDEELVPGADEELAGDRFVKGDRISLEVTPADPEESGPAYLTGHIEVADAPPRFVSTPPSTFRSATYIYRAQAEDADGDPLTYTLESGPEGMSIDSRTGEVRWPFTPEQVGRNVVRISVSDDSGQKDVQEYSLEIQVKK